MLTTLPFFEEQNALSRLFTSRVPMTEDEMMFLFERIQFETIEKDAIIAHIGDMDDKIYMVLDGIARGFCYNENDADKEVSLDFYFKGSVICLTESFVDKLPLTRTLEALTPLSVVTVSYENVLELQAKIPSLAELSQLVTDEVVNAGTQRVKDLVALTATERYEKLLKTQPEYVQQIPLKYLASYLNITPQSLSRIRKQLA